MRLHEIRYSTNVERVQLALAHKGLEAEHVVHDASDRGAIEALSGQPLVPVLELDDGEVVADSTARGGRSRPRGPRSSAASRPTTPRRRCGRATPRARPRSTSSPTGSTAS